MPESELEFVTYLANHFRVIESLCVRQVGFESNDELLAYLASITDSPESAARRATRLKDVGALVQVAAGWIPPPFLVKFIRELKQRHVLASPEVVRSWIGQLETFAQQLSKELIQAQNSPIQTEEEPVASLLGDIDYTFSEVIRIVHSNCERIATEVADYRATEDTTHIRRRLSRLIELHDDYLQPLLRIIDIKGAFYDLAERISRDCELIAIESGPWPVLVRQKAGSVRELIVWLRNAVIRQAEEAKRELAPLCLAAVKEHQISVGVNRALESIRQGNWESLDIVGSLQILNDKDSSLFSNLAIERHLIDVKCFKEEKPPVVQICLLYTSPSPRD